MNQMTKGSANIRGSAMTSSDLSTTRLNQWTKCLVDACHLVRAASVAGGQAL